MSALGKKVFFLYPPSVVSEELVWEIVRNEYEVYVLKEHVRLRKLLPRYNDAIVFINIDAGKSEESWAAYVRDLSSDPSSSNVRIGILTYNKSEELARKYLTTYTASCRGLCRKRWMPSESRGAALPGTLTPPRWRYYRRR